MDTAAGISFGKGGDKEGGTLGRLEVWGGPRIYSVLGVELFGKLEDINIFCFHALFFHA